MTSRKAVKDTQRKRRLARLPSAILPEGGYPGPKFEPTAEDWQRMKEAYRHPHPLDVADRQEIGRLVSNYFDVQPYERSAPFVEDVEKWLAKVHTAADRFHLALEELEAEIERDAALHAKVLIELRLEKMPWRSMDDVRNATADFLVAAFDAKNKFKDGAGKGFAEGDAWNKLVRGLSNWFNGKRLPTGASKGGNLSDFVAFMCELQKTFPKDFRRHMHSDGALAAGIKKARAAGA